MQQTKWVEFVGGPLHGQCRSIPVFATTWNAAPPPRHHATPYTDGQANIEDETVEYVTYNIVVATTGRPGTIGYREGFKGVLA